jgi:hypothetical protein
MNDLRAPWNGLYQWNVSYRHIRELSTEISKEVGKLQLARLNPREMLQLVEHDFAPQPMTLDAE